MKVTTLDLGKVQDLEKFDPVKWQSNSFLKLKTENGLGKTSVQTWLFDFGGNIRHSLKSLSGDLK